MGRHKPKAALVNKNDLKELKFKPASYRVMKSTTNTPLLENKKLPSASSSSGSETTISAINMSQPATPEVNSERSNAPNTSDSYHKILKGHVVPSKVYQVPTRNSYEVLSDKDVMETDDEDDSQVNNDNPNTNKLEKTKKVSKPPPIVIHHKMKNTKEFSDLLKKDITKGFELKYTKNNTNLFIKDTNEYRKYLQKIKKNQEDKDQDPEDKLEFHTYTEKSEKNHAFVLKGLDSDLDYLKEELENQSKINVVNVYEMKNAQGLFLVITDNSITEKYLNKNLNVVCHTRVTWARHVNRKQIIQCHRCQQWGHATSNCSAKLRCLKCSNAHWSRDCTLVSKDDVNTHQHIKCPNCEGKHLAFSQDCPVYIRRVELINKSKERRNYQQHQPAPRYIPAPPPKTNPWLAQNRSQNHQVAEQAQPRQVNNLFQNNVESENSDNNTFTTLLGEFQTLNSLVDLEYMLKLVKELNLKLINCKNEMEQFLVINRFCSERFPKSCSP